MKHLVAGVGVNGFIGSQIHAIFKLNHPLECSRKIDLDGLVPLLVNARGSQFIVGEPARSQYAPMSVVLDEWEAKPVFVKCVRSFCPFSCMRSSMVCGLMFVWL